MGPVRAVGYHGGMDENPYQSHEAPPENPLPSKFTVKLYFIGQWLKRYVWFPILVILTSLFLWGIALKLVHQILGTGLP